MKKRHKIELPEVEFESPELIESSSSEATLANDFCMPDDCPEIINTPRFPSPTSCLPEERLHELEEKIDAANRLLLDLGLSNEQKENGRRTLFDGLKGQKVRVKINCTKEAEEDIGETQTAELENFQMEEVVNKKQKMDGSLHSKRRAKSKRVKKKIRQYKYQRRSKKQKKDFLEGIVQLVGRNFLELKTSKKIILIPFSRICLVLTKRIYKPPVHEPALIDIDPCFRRELTFNFGETVANNPELVQLFFRIHLTRYLNRFKEEKLTVRTDQEQIQGILKGVGSDSIFVEVAAGNPIMIPAESICTIMKN